MMPEDESLKSSKEKTVLKDPKIRDKYNDLIKKGKLSEAKLYLAFQVNFMDIHESNSKKGKRLNDVELLFYISIVRICLSRSHLKCLESVNASNQTLITKQTNHHLSWLN